MASDSIFQAIKAKGNLPSPNGIALRVIQLTQQDDVTNQQIAHVIKVDPALSGRVIKMANALVAYQTRPVISVVDAVTVLGLNSLRQLVLSLSVVAGNSKGTCDKFDYEKFWGQSLLTAIVAQKLVLQRHIGSPEEIFILGLMAQIGRLALASSYPQKYALMLEQVISHETVLNELELAEFGFNHSQLTKELLADWGMPFVFQKFALYHEEPEQAGFTEGSRDWSILNVLHVANSLAAVCMAQEQQRHKMVPKMMLSATRLGVETDMLTELGDSAVKEWHEWSKLFGIKAFEIPPFSQLLAVAPLTTEMPDTEVLRSSVVTTFKLHILLVDDDRSILSMQQHLLTQAGHSVTTARNGLEALSAVSKSVPQLIISDWAMPKMDGIAFCKELRRNPEWCNIHVFIMSPHAGADYMVKAFEAGANDYLTKPINFKVMGARLWAAQRVVQLQEELERDRQQLRKFATELADSNQRLQQLALTDALTELPNRRYANEQLDRQWALAERNERSFSCMMVDIDHFKKINDTFGHKIGDDVLKQVADVLRTSARKQDMVCRLGGEEFLVICPDSKPDQVFQYAERLRKNVAASNIHNNDSKDINLTVSIGLSYKKPEVSNVEMLLQLADKRLYAAKHGGRNMTVAS